MTPIPFFFNQCLDKGRLKRMILWSLTYQGEYQTIQLIENLKTIGFQYATYAGVSLGIDDLSIPPKKADEVFESESFVAETALAEHVGNRTTIETLQSVIDSWHRTSENVKQHVIDYFEATNILNPVYMMAFSGARGNVSQVRQLVGLRGLMADAQGDIIGFPIRSNFREGLTVTEYMISCYGARKGVVDTALRTADAGYLTRRLVDVAQHVVVQKGSCGTRRGISLESLKEYGKVVLPLQERLIGRVFASDFIHHGVVIARRNQPISEKLASRLSQLVQTAQLADTVQSLHVRSPLTCELVEGVCQLCYGWSLAQSSIVTLGEAVGIIAGQSIGEPGTQLTMRTFHTGGVFTGEVQGEFRAPHGGWVAYPEPFQGELIRTEYGQVGFLVKHPGTMLITGKNGKFQTRIAVPTHTALFIREGEQVRSQQVIGQFGDGSSRRNERRQTRKIVFSRLSGQVLYSRTRMTETPLEEYTAVYATPLRPQYRVTSKLGTVWILAGDHIGSAGSLLHMYRSSGHLLESGALLKRFSILGNQDGIVCFAGAKVARPNVPQAAYLLPPLASKFLSADQALSALSQHADPVEKALYTPIFTGTFQRVYTGSYPGYTFIKTPTHDCFIFNNKQQEESSLHVQLQLPRPSTSAWAPPAKRGELIATYFPSIFKAEGGGFFWRKQGYAHPACKHGVMYWAPRPSHAFIPLARSIRSYLEWSTDRAVRTRLVPPNAPLTPQFHCWALAQQALWGSTTLQNVLRTVYAPTYGLVQYEGEAMPLLKSSDVNCPIRLVAESTINPLTGRVNQTYTRGKLFSSNAGFLQFPFAAVKQTVPAASNVTVYPGWLYFPQPFLFNSNIVQSGINSSAECESFMPALIDVQAASVQKPRRRTQQFYSKIYSEHAHVSVSTIADTPLNLLPSFRKIFSLRHPELIQFLLTSTVSCTPRQAYDDAAQFYVFSHALSPWFYLVQPSSGLSCDSLNAMPTFIDSSFFMGWVYKSVRFKLTSTPALRAQTRDLHGVNFNALVRATLVILNTKDIPYSFDHMVTVRRRLALAQTFEGAQLQHRTWTSSPPVWVKQATTQLLPHALKTKVTNRLFIAPFRRLATKSTYAFRVVSKVHGVSADVTVKLSFSGLPGTDANFGRLWSFGTITKPFQATQRTTLQGSVNTIRLAHDPVIIRSRKLRAIGETFITPKNEVIFLRSQDIMAVAPKYFRPQDLLVSVGQTLRFGEELMPGVATPISGQIFAITPSQIIVRRGQPVLFYKGGSLHVQHEQWINMGHPLVTLTYQRLVTGDIVQGIPKVEQVFEASQSNDAEVNLPKILRHTFRSLKKSMVLPKATRTSLEMIQRQIIDRIQKIYLSQGVTISDKHFEVIVRQMTSKVRVLYPGDTGLFRGEIMPLIRVEGINAGTLGRKARYAPIISGISATALSSDSFLSAASFQETTRVLTRDAIARKTDFLRGLKERVILGDLIPAGTGLSETIVYRRSAVLEL